MTPFYTILTNYGKTALAEALAAQQPLEIPHMAVGDGGGAYYEPVEEQTNLRNELWRGDLNDLRTDEEIQGQVIAEAIIPMGIDGDWTAREIGLFDTKGGLVAVGKYPESYIPSALSGAKTQVHISIIIKVDNVAALQLIVDHGQVLASKLYVNHSTEKGKEQLKEELAADDGSLIGTGNGNTLKDRLDILPRQSIAVYIDNFLNVTSSFSQAIQAAVDSIDADETGKYSSKIIIPRGRFRVTESVFFYEKDGLHLQGAGDGATILEVDTILNTPLPFEFQAINGKYKGYTYNENAVFIIAARRVTQVGGSSGMHGKGNGAAWRVKFSDFKIEATGDAYRKTQGIYSPEVGLSDFKDITTHGLHSTITAADLYVVTGENIYMFDCDYPIKHGIGVNAQGTTLNMVNCVASKVKYGWYFSKLSYSSFQNIAIDGWGDGHTGANISAFAYRFDKCDIVMNGCGCESVAGTSFGVFNIFNGSSIVLNGGNYWGGNVSDLVSAQSFIADAGTVLTINGPWWRQGASRDSQLPVSVTNGAVINIIGLSKMNVTAGASLRISDFVNDDLSEVNAIGKNNYVYAANRNSDITSTERTFNVPFTTETIDTLSAINEYPTSALNVVSAGRYRISACLPIDHSSQLSVSLLVDGIAQYTMPITNNAVAILNCIVICKYKSTIRIVLNDANGVTVKSGSFVNIEKI